jgi:hypothetical protein
MQLLKERWGALYGEHFPWNDGLALYRWEKIDRDGRGTIVTEEVKAMGILLLDGDWENVA